MKEHHMTKKQTKQFSVEIDPISQKVIGSSSSENDDLISQDISKRIVNTIRKTFDSLSDNWIEEYCEKISDEEFIDAYLLFEKNRWRLRYCNDKSVLQKLKLMNSLKLDREKRKNFLISLIAFSCYLGERKDIDNLIEDFLFAYKEELEPLLVQNLMIEKANIAAIEGLYNKASVLYKGVASNCGSDAGVVAWAYQGLSKIASDDRDIMEYAEKAADKHLEAGNKRDAIKNILVVSDLKAPNEPEESIRFLDYAMSLIESDNLIDRAFLATIKHKKSIYLCDIGINDKALLCAEEACSLRKGLIGNEVEYHASLKVAEALAKLNDDPEKEKKYQLQSKVLSEAIDDDKFLLRCKLASIIVNGEQVHEDFISEINSTCDDTLISTTLAYKSLNNDLAFNESLGLLDQARLIAEKHSDNHLLTTIHFAFGEQYRKEEQFEEAVKNYKTCLMYNAFFRPAYQNYTAMLFKSENWSEAEKFIKERIELVGELPGICFIYGRALLENKKYPLAFKYFKKADSNKVDIEKYITECVKNINDKELEQIEIDNPQPEKHISASMFYGALKEFAISISSESRMHFWEMDKPNRQYKWTRKPEELSKQMLITFLNGKFGTFSIESLPEVRAGAGFIDLYVILPGGLKVVVELKMCGAGYSSNYALSGESQIIHYQNNKNTKLGYLLVLDARKRDYGKHFKTIQTIGNNTIYTIAADMRPKVDKA